MGTVDCPHCGKPLQKVLADGETFDLNFEAVNIVNGQAFVPDDGNVLLNCFTVEIAQPLSLSKLATILYQAFGGETTFNLIPHAVNYSGQKPVKD